MKMILRAAVIVASISWILSSCDNLSYVSGQQDQNFINSVGSIDSEQTWNLATSASVTVTTSSATDVNIYAGDGSAMKLAASYSGVTGTKTLTFDVVEGVESVIVADMTNNDIQSVELGGTVSFPSESTSGYATKSVVATTTSDVTVKKISDYATFLNIDELASESHGQSDATDELFTANGEITLYPIHFQTSGDDTFGIYYYDASGNIVKVPFFVNDYDGNYVADNFIQYSSIWDPNNWQTANKTGIYYGQNRRAKGISITLPANTKYGYYVSNYIGWGDVDTNTYTFYTEGSLNGDGVSHYVYWEEDGYKFMSFEDYTDYDYNDMVFVV
ncbi:MAG: hypothetical protein K5984_06690, partial [Bacteroidales bacterium]|nr:hypothetical protein [Bacteroidales bacterium]